jgi:hypothetical protein
MKKILLLTILIISAGLSATELEKEEPISTTGEFCLPIFPELNFNLLPYQGFFLPSLDLKFLDPNMNLFKSKMIIQQNKDFEIYLGPVYYKNMNHFVDFNLNDPLKNYTIGFGLTFKF